MLILREQCIALKYKYFLRQLCSSISEMVEWSEPFQTEMHSQRWSLSWFRIVFWSRSFLSMESGLLIAIASLIVTVMLRRNHLTVIILRQILPSFITFYQCLTLWRNQHCPSALRRGQKFQRVSAAKVGCLWNGGEACLYMELDASFVFIHMSLRVLGMLSANIYNIFCHPPPNVLCWQCQPSDDLQKSCTISSHPLCFCHIPSLHPDFAALIILLPV